MPLKVYNECCTNCCCSSCCCSSSWLLLLLLCVLVAVVVAAVYAAHLHAFLIDFRYSCRAEFSSVVFCCLFHFTFDCNKKWHMSAAQFVIKCNVQHTHTTHTQANTTHTAQRVRDRIIYENSCRQKWENVACAVCVCVSVCGTCGKPCLMASKSI